MRKLFMMVIGMLFAALAAGCGGSGGSSGTRISAITTVAISEADVAGKTFQIKNSDLSLTTFSSATTSNGNILLTAPDATVKTVTCIQREDASSYWLVYDTSTFAIVRLYFDGAAANAYDPQLMGGAIQGNPAILASASSQVTLFAGDPTVIGESELDGDALTSATFDQPHDITADRNNYYVLDFTNGRIRQISKSGYTVTTWTLKDSSGSTVTLDEPEGITNYGDYLYVADTDNHVIRRISKAESGGSHLTTVFAGNADETAGSVDDAIGSDAYFNTPTGITTDGTNLYVVDSGNGTIRKIIVSTTAVSTLAGKNGEIGDDDGVYTDARFYGPRRVTTDGSSLYITDTQNRTIRKLVIATGSVSTLAGDPDADFGHVDGSGSVATFYYPFGITCDGANLYVTDFSDLTIAGTFDNRIRRIALSGVVVTTVAGGESVDTYSEEPNPLSVADGSVSGSAARFANPRGIVWDGSLSRLYVTNGGYELEHTSAGAVKVGDSTWNCLFRITASSPS